MDILFRRIFYLQ